MKAEVVMISISGFPLPDMDESPEVLGHALPLPKTVLHLSFFAHPAVFQGMHKAMGAQPKSPACLAHLVTIAGVGLDKSADFWNLQAGFVVADVIALMGEIVAGVKLAVRTNKQLLDSGNADPVGPD